MREFRGKFAHNALVLAPKERSRALGVTLRSINKKAEHEEEFMGEADVRKQVDEAQKGGQMRKKTLSLFLLALGLPLAAQDIVQLTPVPPKPTCVQIFNMGTCADMWRAYNQAVAQRQREELQLYVNRQKQLASDAATAPLQQQIAGLNKLVADQQAQLKTLQEQMQADASAALQARQADAAEELMAKNAAHRKGLWTGAGIGAGGTLVLLAVVFGVVRFSRKFTITKKSQVASA